MMMAFIGAVFRIFRITAIVLLLILLSMLPAFYIAAYIGDATGWYRIEDGMRMP
jgi:hypothetical protein